jgi:uncharacterized OB-fold protein
MNSEDPFTIEQFYKFISQGQLMAGKCKKCGKIHLPPRPLCDNCYNKEFTWVTVTNRGKLITYTVIHIAPQQFQHASPYAIGILQLENGNKLPGMITDIPHDQLQIGMDLTLHFTKCESTQTWPPWPRYCFKPK